MMFAILFLCSDGGGGLSLAGTDGGPLLPPEVWMSGVSVDGR